MTEPRPRLVAVDTVQSAPEPSADPRSGARVAFWVLAALVFVCALAAAYQTQHVARLDAELAVANAELTTARTQLETAHTQLDAHQGHLVEIRSAVSQLRSQLGQLDELTQRDPLADLP